MKKDKSVNVEKELKKQQKLANKDAKMAKKIANSFKTKIINEENYISKGYSTDKNYSVFSTLDILNKNNDLFKYTKNTVSTVLKTIFTASEIENFMQETGCSNFKIFSKKVQKAMEGKQNDVNLSAIASSVSQFLNKVKSEEASKEEDKNFDANYLESTVEKRASGPHNLVNQVTTVYGTNRYLDYETEILKLSPLYTKFDSENEAIEKINEISNYIKNSYGYNLTYSTRKNPVNLITKTIKLDKYEGKLDSCVNMLYSVSKKLTGSKKVGINIARKMLNKKEHNEYFDSKVYDHKFVKQIYKEQKDTIKDIVSTFTTIFMARFVFEAPKFGEIERDLTEQACVKMKTLRISTNADEDYWINQLIQDRLKVNVTQVLAANNITNAKQLLEIYNKNGTKIVNPENVTCLDDLVFALQYNESMQVENGKLSSLKENEIKLSKPSLKNKEVKVKKQKPNKYLDNVIRKSDKYKEYYQMYLNKFKALNIDFGDENIKYQLKEIKNGIDNSLSKLEELTQDNDLNAKQKDKVTDMTAKGDAIATILDAEKNKTEEKVEEKSLTTSFVDISNEVAEKANVPNNQIAMKDVLDINEDNDETYEQLSLDDYFATQSSNQIDEVMNESEENEESDTQEHGFVFVANSQEDADKLNVLSEQVILKDNQNEDLSETENSNVFKTEKALQSLPDEKVKNKIKKYYNKLMYGQNGKVGIVGELLNYRVIEKSNKKTTYASDNERLDDKDLSRANKIRDQKVEEIINTISDATFKYYSNFKDSLSNLTVPKLCNYTFRQSLNIDDSETFTKKDLKKCLSVMVTKQVNEELKQYNIELYTGKKTYKKFNEVSENIMEVK